MYLGCNVEPERLIGRVPSVGGYISKDNDKNL